MSEKVSPSTNCQYGIALVCSVWKAPRSSFYHRKKTPKRVTGGRGKKPTLSDNEVLKAIRKDIETSPFQGEGHRKIHARLRRLSNVKVGRNRVLKLMKVNKLLSPYRVDQGKKKPHDGRITTDRPNEMWATDAAKVFTLEDGWVSFFGVIEHWNAECLGWHVSRKGTRFAAIEALNRAVENIFGVASPGIARGVSLRIDHGSQFISEGFVEQSHYWGIAISKGFVKEPETNGVIERFHRTLKEQIVHGRVYHSLEDFRRAVEDFIQRYNESWLLEKLGYHSPLEARRLYAKECSPPISTALAEEGTRARLLCSGSNTSRCIPEVISPCPFGKEESTATLFWQDHDSKS